MRAVEHAIRAGELLIEAKGQVAHGEWLPWLEDNFPASERTARNYMQLAGTPNRQRVADLPLRDALAELATPRPVPEPVPSLTEMAGPKEIVTNWQMRLRSRI